MMAGKMLVGCLLVLACCTLGTPALPVGPFGILRSLIVNNIAGPKVVHETQYWDFDPDISSRRRLEFEATYGRMGEKLIERLGLGEDGYQEERRQQQKARDKLAGY